MPNQFVVPQFIDVEDKILGPISVRQFIIVLIGGGALVGAYQILVKLANQVNLFVVSALGILAAVMLFAFIRVNGRPFHLFLLNVLQSVQNPHLRIWNNQAADVLHYRSEPAPPPPLPTKQPLAKANLAKLALLVDTGGAYHEDDDLLYIGQPIAPPKSKP